MHEINIFWFKKDLRIKDNEAFYEASRKFDVLPLYIIEKQIWQQETHSHRQWEFCKECLIDLNEELKQLGQPLIIRVGNVIDILEDLKNSFIIKAIYSHQETGDFLSYSRDKKVKRWVKENNIPWKEFLQFAVFRGKVDRNLWSKSWKKHIAEDIKKRSFKINLLKVKINELPSDEFFEFKKDACKGRLKGGRKEGIKRLNYFLENKIDFYSKDISSPQKSFYSCSRLSPYITWGCLSIREIFKQISTLNTTNGNMFRSRLIWHCHFIQKLETEPELEFKEFHPYFSNIRNKNDFYLKAWSEGKTGYPFLDACMRSLNYNGWINFRMRAMLMSFASYNLWIPWQESGLKLAQKFIDYEPGIHWTQCQMQSGTTSINTNRIYNPIKQGKDHDPNGSFIKKWIPELKAIPEIFIHEPWLINNKSQYLNLKDTNYFSPIINIKKTTTEAKEIIKRISYQEGYDEISEVIYKKHGSRKNSFSKRRKKYTLKEKKIKVIQNELNLGI